MESFNFSQNKVEALSLIEGESLLENVLDISIYKERWNTLTKEDFLFPLEEEFNPRFDFQGPHVLKRVSESHSFSWPYIPPLQVYITCWLELQVQCLA